MTSVTRPPRKIVRLPICTGSIVPGGEGALPASIMGEAYGVGWGWRRDPNPGVWKAGDKNAVGDIREKALGYNGA